MTASVSTKGRKKGNVSIAVAFAILDTGVSMKDLRTAYEGNSPKFEEMVKAGKAHLKAKAKPASKSGPGRPLDENTLKGLKAMKINVDKLPAEGAERKTILMHARNVGKALASPSVMAHA